MNSVYVGQGTRQRDAITRAILFMGVSALASSALHIGVRALSDRGLPSIEIVFLRTLFTIFVTLPLVLRPGQAAWRSNVPKGHMLRGAIGMLSMWAWYYALGNMALGDAVTLGQTTGLFLTVGAAFWFGERIGIARWGAVLMGFLGAVIVLRPGFGVVSMPALLALFSSALWAISLLLAKDMAKHDSALTITFYQPLTIAPLALIGTIPVWVTPSLADLGLLTLLAIIAGFGNYCTVRALSLADASVTVPVDYTKLLWSIAAGYVIFNEAPGLASWLGVVLIAGSTLFIAIYERRGLKV